MQKRTAAFAPPKSPIAFTTTMKSSASLYNHYHHHGASGPLSAASSSNKDLSKIADSEEITAFASSNGVDLQSTTNLFRDYRGVALAKNDPENILGYIEGVVRPVGKILHADKMEIFKGASNSARSESDGFSCGGTFLGPGLLIAYVCLLSRRADAKLSNSWPLTTPSFNTNV